MERWPCIHSPVLLFPMTKCVTAHSRLPQPPAVDTKCDTTPPGAHCCTTQQVRQCPASQTHIIGNNSSCQVTHTTCVATSHTQGQSQEKKVLVSNFLDGPHISAEIASKFSNANGPKSQAESECLCLCGQGHLSLFKLEK